MTAMSINRISAWVPLVCSGLAFAIVIANIIARVPPQPDENASAHLFQLLMIAQLPFITAFAATADWSRWIRPARLLGLQALAITVALVPVWLAGY